MNRACVEALTQREQRKSAEALTLIELLIAVAIVGILSVLAIGTYQNYTVRAAASEAVTMLDANRNAVASDYQTTGTFPGNATEAGVDQDNLGKYTASVRVGGAGVLYATFLGTAPGPLAGQVLTMTPYTSGADNGTLNWVCGYATPQTGWTAGTADAAGTGNPAPTTSVGPQYLPKSCRAGG